MASSASFSFECHNFLSSQNSWGPPIPPTTRWSWATNIPCLCITVIRLQKPLVVSNAKTCWVCLHAVWERERLKLDACLSVPLIREKLMVYNITVPLKGKNTSPPTVYDNAVTIAIIGQSYTCNLRQGDSARFLAVIYFMMEVKASLPVKPNLCQMRF